MPSVEQTTTQVANLAIGHCGISKPIQVLVSDRSLEAQMCRTFIDLARQKVLRAFPWFFAIRQVNPSKVADQPTPEWLYAYQYPSDALKLIRFMSWRLSNDTRQSRIPYTIAQPVPNTLSTLTPQPAPYSQLPGTSMWIYTNWPGALGSAGLPTIIEYIFDNQNVAQWTPDFIEALSLALAMMIAPTITSGDPYGMREKLTQAYTQSLAAAMATNLNEEQRPQEPQSEFIRAREGDMVGIPGSTWVAEPAGFVVF